VALAGLLLAVAGTFGYYYQNAPTPIEATLSGLATRQQVMMLHFNGLSASPQAPSMALLPALARQVELYLPVLVAAWLLGLLLMGGRLVGGLVVANRLRRAGASALGADWQRRLAALASRAGLRRPVALLESARVRGPLVLGHLRPVILLPLGAVAGLPPSLLEALLAHELAHIVRRDYLLNLVLSAVEVLFFYHPAVWFMANCLRAERENCCDDQAAALCGGDRLRVARALAALAELEATTAATPQLALAAAGAGGRGSLLARVRRLALGRPEAPTLGEGLLALLLGVLGVAGLSTGVALAAPTGTKALLTNVKQAIAPADTTRKVKVASAAPAAPTAPAAPADEMRQQVRELVDTEIRTETNRGPRVRTFSYSQNPPRRERASTVVIEKDKKGRVVNLTVDGQPVDTGSKDKKTKRDKKEKVRTVEVVRVPSPSSQVQIERIERRERPERPEQPERPERREFSFNFSTDAVADEAVRAARQALTEAMRSPDLNDEQRQEMKRELAKLQRNKSFQGNLNLRLDTQLQWQDAQRQLRDGQRRLREGQRQLQKSSRQFRVLTLNGDLAQADRAAEQADRDAARADREADRADREAELADREVEGTARTETAARRAELRARIAADAAELRALESGAARPPRAPLPPRAPRASRIIRTPFPAEVPPLPPGEWNPAPPAPPAPPAAPNTVKLREALRKDGLIKDEKHFSFELNDEGGRVNGQALTPAQVAKYRQLMKLPTTKIKGSITNFGITVDEN
jgi:beta-lactamase regulating signal transducer with metallopeptidase domain